MLNDLLNKIYEKRDKEKILYIGYRGSHSTGLARQGSDIDLLVVLDEEKVSLEQFEDVQFISKKDFILTCYYGSLNSIEALVAEVYCSEKFRKTIYDLREDFKNGIFIEGFKASCFKMLKNLIKRVDKEIDVVKSGAKSILYYELINLDNEALVEMLFKKVFGKYKETYLERLENGLTKEDLSLLEKIRKYRSCDGNREMWNAVEGYHRTLVLYKFKEEYK